MHVVRASQMASGPEPQMQNPVPQFRPTSMWPMPATTSSAPGAPDSSTSTDTKLSAGFGIVARRLRLNSHGIESINRLVGGQMSPTAQCQGALVP